MTATNNANFYFILKKRNLWQKDAPKPLQMLFPKAGEKITDMSEEQGGKLTRAITKGNFFV